MSGSTTMEGYLYKKGHALPITQRRYCVLKGTMLSYYTNQDEYTRKQTPRNVLEVVGVNDLSENAGASGGFLSPSSKATSFQIQYLGGTTYECRADSREEKNQWLSAIQHALDEPNRIVQDEIEDAQRHLQQEAEKEDKAMAIASEAVEKAQQFADEALAMDAAIKNAKQERAELDERLMRAQIVLEEAQKKTTHTAHALERARARAHDQALADQDHEETTNDDDQDSELRSSPRRASVTGPPDQFAARISHLVAQLEVDRTAEATHAQDVAKIQASITENEQQIDEFRERAKLCASEGRKLRETAAANLHSAKSAREMSRSRVSSWTASSSHLDPLAEGYLLCKHPLKPSMHRRYYVLYGNTLCWYKDVDDYNEHVDAPSGVVHVAAVSEWSGKVGGVKTFPHAFAIATVEGKTLYCSAPVKQSVVTWETALHIGLTMPALSPHLAMQAKARRDSMDLLSTSGVSSPENRRTPLSSATDPSDPTTALRISTDRKPLLAPASPLSKRVSAIVIEGYLVKKSSLFPTMKRKYCVLDRLRLGIFESHEQYDTARAEGKHSGDHEDVMICGVSDWDGHGALLQYHHGFQIHTVDHHMIQCSAANENEKTKWITGIHEALLLYKDQLLSPTRREEKLLEDTKSAIFESVQSTDSSSQPPAAAFRAKILQVYMEHHPAKAHDVPMLLEKYAGRERVLVTHLDSIYGTTLAQDAEVMQLVEALESAAKETRRGRRRLSSGVTSGLNEFGKMEGMLRWMPLDNHDEKRLKSPSAPSFSVLSVDKLVRYASETVYMTEPFHTEDAIQLLSVADAPSGSSTSFCVTYTRLETKGKPPTNPSSPRSELPTMQLDALGEEQRTLWMAKIRSGLGFAETHATSPRETSSPTDPVTETLSADIDGLRRKLIEYYRRQNPRRLGEIDTLLHYFAGREKLLLVDLDATYGTSISTDAAFLTLLPSSAQPQAQTQPTSNDVLHYESYLWVKHPAIGAGFQKCYCVLRNTEWHCFENSRDAHAVFPSSHSMDRPTSPRAATKPHLMKDVVVNLNYLNSKLHNMRVFNIEGQTHGAILLRADVEPLFQDWTRALRQAADLQQRLDEPIQADEMPAWWRALHEKLVQFYQQHHPGKEHELLNLLRSFEGRERDLLVEIDRIHHTQLAQDPDYLTLLPDPVSVSDTEIEDTEASSSSRDAILMEGYLVKRGHLVPSMRKRYCVLVKNILTYYLTHEDSRSSDVQPLGSFRVEIVSDWHGKTTMQTYEFGMELETHDGKTFFCAAFSSEEKTQWIRAFHHGIAIARADAAAEGSSDSPDSAVTPESEEDRAKRDQFRERLAAYYREYNPRKLVDLDLLLACYKGRELSMLEAMDATYGSQLLQDESILRLLPPLNAHTQALRKLEYDGPLERAANGNSDAAWKHAQQVYVSQKGLTLTFYASREGFKAGAAALTSAADRAVTVLAVKTIDGSCRFAVETTEHNWMYFQAPNVLEKAHWVQLLQAALDGMLAKTILEEERLFLAQQQKDVSSSTEAGVVMKGYLMVRMDFFQSLEDYRQQLHNLSGSPMSPSSPRSDTFACDSTSSLMKECFVVLQNHHELLLYPDDNHTEVLATLTALATRAWKAAGGVAPLSSDSTTVGRFPFQVLTQEQIVLSCGAATDLERAKWIQQIRRGAQQAAAVKLLQQEFDESQEPAEKRERRPSILDESTGELRGYLYYQVEKAAKTATDDETEGFLVLDSRAFMRIYTDETAFLRRERPLLSFRVVEIVKDVTSPQVVQTPGGHFRRLFGSMTGSPKAKPRHVFQLQIVDEGEASHSQEEQRTISFFPAATQEKLLWTNAVRAGINTRKGEQLLRDEKAVLAIEVAHAGEDSGDDAFVSASSAIEGTLTLWRMGEAAQPVYAMLTHCQLVCYASRELAMSALSGSREATTSVDLTIGSFSDWEPPAGPTESAAGRGFQVHAASDSARRESTCFTASTLHEKSRWLHAIQHELDFEMAEKYLDEDAKEFARLAAAHLVAGATQGISDSSSGTDTTALPSVRREGYVRVRHQHVESMWRERFAVVIGLSLWLFKDGGDACAEDWQRLAIERHELIAAHEWTPVTAAGARDTQYRYGISLENQDGAGLELTFAVAEDRDTWLNGISGCLERSALLHGEKANRFISRDAALAFVPGAAMEGYLKVRKKQRSRFKLSAAKWRTQYAVLIGTQWLLYETQQQAIALHGHNQQDDAAEQKEEGEDILPQAVLDVIAAEPWQPLRASRKAGEDEDLESHGFVVVSHKASAFGGNTTPSVKKGADSVGDIMECKAQTSLERKRWLHAIHDQIASVAREHEVVRKAMEQHKDKAMAHEAVKAKFTNIRADADRQALVVQDILASLATEDTTSEEEEEETGDEGPLSDDENVHGPLTIRSRSIARVHSPENSPMYRQDLEEQKGESRAFFSDEDYPYQALGSPSKAGRKPKAPWYSWERIFACCFDRPPSSDTSYAASVVTIAPLKNPKYVYEYYSDDKPSHYDDF